MITIKRGDLLCATEDIIAHQVNCQGVAGGLAYHVFRKWPDAGNDYLQQTERMGKADVCGQRFLLGHTMITGQQPDGKIIANLYGQYYPGADYRPEALRRALTMLAEMAKTLDRSVALPYRLSCGICGGDWDEVQQIIRETMEGVEVAIYRREEDETF